jgi:hypothetical protein
MKVSKMRSISYKAASEDQIFPYGRRKSVIRKISSFEDLLGASWSVPFDGRVPLAFNIHALEQHVEAEGRKRMIQLRRFDDAMRLVFCD